MSGAVHNWETCRCGLCLAAQRVFLLLYNSKLGSEFTEACTAKLRTFYVEILDLAESSGEGVGEFLP